jgi:hypothetical protein
LLQESEVYEETYNHVSESIIDIFSWEPYEKEKLLASSI